MALFIVLAVGSACLAFMFWVFGIGVPRLVHNLAGLWFVAVHAVCVAGGARLLVKGHSLAAMACVLAALPACVAAVLAAISLGF